MPILTFANNETETFTFPENTTLHFAKLLCKEAQRRVSPITARYDVKASQEDKTRMVAKLWESGANKLKKNLELMIKQSRSDKFSISRDGLQFFVDTILEEHDFKVICSISYSTEYYSSRIDTFGPQRDEFIECIKKYKEDYVFTIPRPLAQIVISKMELKISLDNIVLINGGPSCIVFARGRFASEFMTDFHNLCKTLVEEYVEFPENEYPNLDDENIIKMCRNISDPNDVFYYIKNRIAKLTGFKESIYFFIDSLKIKADFSNDKNQIEKQKASSAEQSHTETPRVTICQSNSDEELFLEDFNNEISFGEE